MSQVCMITLLHESGGAAASFEFDVVLQPALDPSAPSRVLKLVRNQLLEISDAAVQISISMRTKWNGTRAWAGG